MLPGGQLHLGYYKGCLKTNNENTVARSSTVSSSNMQVNLCKMESKVIALDGEVDYRFQNGKTPGWNLKKSSYMEM